MLIAIAAMTSDRVIGMNNTLPRHLPDDMKRFKDLTTWHTVVMGRKTYESLPEHFRPLPKRKNIVISRSTTTSYPEEVSLFHSIQEFLKRYADHTHEIVYIIGGSQIYNYFLSLCDKLYISELKEIYAWDTYFPEFSDKFVEYSREKFPDYDFVIYQKKAIPQSHT